MPRTRPRGLAALSFVLLSCALASAQPTPDQQAEAILNTGRKAYNDGNPQFAAEQFTELLAKFGGTKHAQSARYGLGLALLDLPDRNYQKALEVLNPAANDANFPDRALALYYAGACQRGLGQKELAEGAARPNEMPQRQNNANGKFTEAARLFTQAREAFEKRKPADAEWAARARCDLAEMELRLNKPKEARATVEPLLKDAKFAKSKLRPLALYYHGTASFLLNDIPSAAKSLGQLAPFDQPFGPHARYLVGRVHAAQGENAEAAAAFTEVLAEYARQKAVAAEALKQPDKFKNDPWEKARLESLVKNAPPDYVAGAAFYAACLQYEAGKFGEAQAKFDAFAKDYANSPLKDDAHLRAGFCQVQTKQYDAAGKTLQPLTNHPRLADQALFWLGKAQAGMAAAAANNPNQKAQNYTAAINTLRSAADRANQMAAQDPDAKARRAEILLELADAQLGANRAKEAAATYETIWNEKLLPAKAEETLQRLVTAYHLAGDLATSEARIATFRQQFPNSTLMPLVLFRGAENAYAKAEELAKQKKPEAKAAFADAEKKYAEVAAKYPEFERVNRAKFGQALCLIAAGDDEKAIKTLEGIPAAERNGDLAPVAYVLADCQIRTAPAKAEDALQDNILREKLTAAAGMLDAFIAANPKSEQTPDAILKYGYCQKRLAAQLQPGNERNDALNKARAALERLPREFPQSPLVGAANLERAKVMVLQGDKGGAINSLRAFANDPLAKSPAAPLAMIALASLLREQNNPAEAAKVLQDARQKFEGGLSAGQKAEWVALLRFHHGVALFEGQKLAEARAAFEQATQAAPALPIAVEASLKGAQCQAEEAKKKVDALEKQKSQPNLKPEQVAAIDNQVKAAKQDLANVGKLFEQRAESFKAAHADSPARARMLYDAAWTYRAAGADPAPAYTKLIAQFPDLSLAVEARLELAELLTEKGKADDAITLLKEAIDKEPTDKPTPQETTERVRIRLGVALFDKKDFAAAQGQFDAVGNNEKSPLRAQGLYRAAECLLAQNKADEAAKKLAIFRDNNQFHNVAGVSDRALLRLGHALSQLKQWDAARQAFETVINRYGNNNAWAVDARYGIGWAFQNQGRYDDAVNAYALVTQATTDDRAARAHLQIGLCRAAAKKWSDAGKAFATVYFGYDLPELKYPAMIEHARALVEEKKPAEAAKLLERAVKDAPKDSEWAKAAQEQLGKIKK